MAGVYGEINSRADFFRVLDSASKFAESLRARSPQDETIAAVLAQLQAIERWTANGGVPTEAETDSLDMGLRVTRELGETGDRSIDRFVEQVQILHNYIEDWPSDEDAARATDDDFFESD